MLYSTVTLACRKCAWHLHFEVSSVVPTWNRITSFSGVDFHHRQFWPTLRSAYKNISVAVMNFGWCARGSWANLLLFFHFTHDGCRTSSVEVSREHKHRRHVGIFHVCIIESGRPLKNGSILNPSGGVGGLYLEVYPSLNYTSEGCKTFIQRENGGKLTGGPEWKHLIHPRSLLRFQRRSISTQQKKIFLRHEWASDYNPHLAGVDWWPSTFMRWSSGVMGRTTRLYSPGTPSPQCSCVK